DTSTVAVPALSLTLASTTCSTGVAPEAKSSARMIPLPTGTVISLAWTKLESTTWKTSVGSTVVSPLTCTDTGRERECAALRRVVGRCGGRRVLGGVVDRRDLAQVAGTSDRECERGRRGVALVGIDVVDAEAGVVVLHDRPDTLGVGDDGVGAASQVEREGLRRFAEGVTAHVDGDRLRRGPGRERERAGGGDVVVGRLGGAVGRRVLHGHWRGAGRAQRHDEVEGG